LINFLLKNLPNSRFALHKTYTHQVKPI